MLDYSMIVENGIAVVMFERGTPILFVVTKTTETLKRRQQVVFDRIRYEQRKPPNTCLALTYNSTSFVDNNSLSLFLHITSRDYSLSRM